MCVCVCVHVYVFQCVYLNIGNDVCTVSTVPHVQEKLKAAKEEVEAVTVVKDKQVSLSLWGLLVCKGCVCQQINNLFPTRKLHLT